MANWFRWNFTLLNSYEHFAAQLDRGTSFAFEPRGSLWRAGDAFVRLIRDYPRLLTFDVSSNGQTLELGPARAEVDVIEEQYRGRISNVSYWREGAAFETAPVSPRKPGSD